MQILDMLGQPCPIPVIQAKKALAQPGTAGVVVTVDNQAAVKNLEKMALGMGHGFSFQQQGEDIFLVTLTANDTPPPPVHSAPQPACPQPVETGDIAPTVLIGSDKMGEGSDELGRILIKGFLFALTELPTPPKAAIFLNGGALLTTQGANTVPDLQALAQKGVKIVTCGTCANFYNITQNLAVGEIANMMDIATLLAEAGRLITL